MLIIGFSAIACQQSTNNQKVIQAMPYPVSQTDSVIDNYFGHPIADPYRWLEADTAQKVKEWVVQQNNCTQDFLNQIPFKSNIKDRLAKIWNYERLGTPFKEGNDLYFFKNDGLQNQSVLYKQTGLNGKAQLFLDPNKLSADGTTSLSGITFSKDHQFMAVSIAKSGSDWNEIIVIETKNGNRLKDQIQWVKFSNAVWRGNGFYYSRYDEPKAGKAFSGQNEFMKIYYHEMGKSQSEDVLIYEDKLHPLRYFNAAVTEDERYLLINCSEGTSGSEIWFQDLNKNENKFNLLFKGFTHNYSVIDNVDNQLLVLTDYNAPTYQLVQVDPLNPSPSNWKTIIAASENLLEQVSTCGGKLFATFLKDASSRLFQYSYSGVLEHEIPLPEIGTTSGISGKKTDQEAFYSFSSFTNPGEIYHYNVENGTSTLFKKTTINLNTSDFETKQVFYPSKDGVKIPLFIISKKGLKLDGNNPTLLYGYGGFNINLTPGFSISRMAFLEQGGIYAVANLRGGGEYGEAWHQAGMLAKKQTVFDDFIAAAKYLIANKYTSSEKLAIHGGSNGGLLVGACMTQEPTLFKVAIPAVGVLDMLRYHKFTIGWGWAVEYGSSENESQFNYLIKYSPLHNVKKGVNYPATLIMTADHDDRVVPAHSFKFAGTLQANQATNGNPVLIRIDSKAGHGAGKPTTKLIDDATDMWSFILWNLGAGYKKIE